MSFESWVKNSWLERLDSDAAEIARLLGLADRRLDDYERAVVGKLSPDVQLTLPTRSAYRKRVRKELDYLAYIQVNFILCQSPRFTPV
jgi:hypothetical protein